jgi:Protein of unknown function (DUF3309)
MEPTSRVRANSYWDLPITRLPGSALSHMGMDQGNPAAKRPGDRKWRKRMDLILIVLVLLLLFGGGFGYSRWGYGGGIGIGGILLIILVVYLLMGRA